MRHVPIDPEGRTRSTSIEITHLSYKRKCTNIYLAQILTQFDLCRGSHRQPLALICFLEMIEQTQIGVVKRHYDSIPKETVKF